MLRLAFKVVLTLCLLYVGYGSAMERGSASAPASAQQQQLDQQQQSTTKRPDGRHQIAVANCRDGQYTSETILNALERASTDLQTYLNTGVEMGSLIRYLGSESHLYATSILHPNNNNPRGMIVINSQYELINVVTQTKITHPGNGGRIEFTYEPCSSSYVYVQYRNGKVVTEDHIKGLARSSK